MAASWPIGGLEQNQDQILMGSPIAVVHNRTITFKFSRNPVHR